MRIIRTMNRRQMYRLIYLSVAAAVSSGVLRADDLDAALEAQKRTAPRRVYSESAFLEDKNLSVPRAVTKEDRDIDRQLRERDAQEEARTTLFPAPFAPVLSAEIRPQQDRNWLTPALLDESANVSLREEDGDWVLRELGRQKETRMRDEEVLRRNENTPRNFRSSEPPVSVLPDLGRLKEYQLAPHQNRPAAEPVTARPFRRDTGVPSSQPYSSGLPGRTPSSAETSLRTPGLSPYAVPGTGSGSTIPSSGLSSDWHIQETAPLTPAQQIRKSSPIHRQDPFRDDLMPRVKSSIWE